MSARRRHRLEGAGRFSTQGFSLTELMIVLVIAAVLLASGLPNFRDMLLRQRLRSTANDMFAAIDFTRTQAIARGERVMMTPADAGGADWRAGWIVFIDRNGNRRPDAGEAILAEQGPVPPGLAVSSTLAGAGPAYVAYNGAGRSCSASNSMAAHFGTLSLFLGDGARHIKINMLGRARICDPEQQGNCSGAADPAS
jgi:type IV fimbrial biogenesis protein FimT